MEALKRNIKRDDTHGAINLKMLAVCASAEPRMDAVTESLLAELADKRDEKIKLIGRCGLDGFLWDQMTRSFGYKSDNPGLRDFVLELFKSCYSMGTDGKVLLTNDALVFLKRWKDSRQFEKCFETLSDECAEILGIEQDLARRDFRLVVELDYFQLIDKKIISDLIRAVTSRTVPAGEVANWIRLRRQGHWYSNFQDSYEAEDYAAQFIYTLNEVVLTMDSMKEGIERYCKSWFRLDQPYRQFTYHVRHSGQSSLMTDLTEQIENLYSNNYLLKVNDRWQSVVDTTHSWDAAPILLQKNFFEHHVLPFLEKDNKIYVIISDALRYEIGDELLSLIRQEDRYDVNIEPALAMLPSYT